MKNTKNYDLNDIILLDHTEFPFEINTKMYIDFLFENKVML